MKKILALTLVLLSYITLFSQEGFQFTADAKKIKIPFQSSNNLMIIPVLVNDAKLNFLLDTGVEKTILFSLEDSDSLAFNNVKKIKIRGLGSGNAIDALHSKNNKIDINGYTDTNHEVYIILDQEINFSSQLGIPVHGIIGYEFFRNHFVEINYIRKKIVVHKNNISFSLKKLKRYEEIPISIEIEKPYIEAVTNLNSKEIKTKLLVDTGGSDALWLFENKKEIECPKNYFNDFLGRGFSGDIYGKRSRIEKFQIGKLGISLPTISFPDTQSLLSVTMVEGRNGSIGGEMLKRFDVVFDYPNQKMYLKKNSNFSEPFNYNMSGIEIQHNGLQWIKETIELKTRFVNTKISVIDDTQKSIRYNFMLKPVYEVTSVRENSPGAIAGIQKSDIISKINGHSVFNIKLHEITDLLQSEEGKTIILEVERNEKTLKFKFQLKKIL